MIRKIIFVFVFIFTCTSTAIASEYFLYMLHDANKTLTIRTIPTDSLEECLTMSSSFRIGPDAGGDTEAWMSVFCGKKMMRRHYMGKKDRAYYYDSKREFEH